MLYTLEKWACRLPDLLILDTHAYVDWFHQNYGIAKDRFRLVPLGADDRIFRPQPNNPPANPDGKFRVTYYGTFIPNHGVPFIIEAARLLAQEDDICFELIGEGPDLATSQALADEYHLPNVTFIRWMDKDALVQHLASTDVCLGAFGRVTQSYITIHNKIYEGLALGKPVITAENPAVKEQFVHGEHLYLCGRDEPQQLADAIMTLRNNPSLRTKLSQEGSAAFQQHYTVEHLGHLYQKHLAELIEARK
jgi:glycosyltransferase involved in cell wall biosynthesis